MGSDPPLGHEPPEAEWIRDETPKRFFRKPPGSWLKMAGTGDNRLIFRLDRFYKRCEVKGPLGLPGTLFICTSAGRMKWIEKNRIKA